MRLAEGSAFAGYRILRRLGRGGMATVYLAQQTNPDRQVALKILPEHLLDVPEFSERFKHEANVVAALDHPNVIPVFASGITDEVPWMALRYVDGGSLSERLAVRPLPVAEGLGILRGIAAALDYAHLRGVIHRDLKPQNVLLAAQGHAYLADFGISKLVEGGGKALTMTKAGGGGWTASGSAIGTPDYMSPEQAMGETVGPPTDVYALAVICFEWLTGRVPFSADTPMAILLRHVQSPLPADLLSTLKPPVAAVLQRGLAKTPEERTPSAGELIAELELALSDNAKPTAIEPAHEQRGGNRFVAGSSFAGYTILGPLGRGGMATVFLAEQSQPRRKLALKVLPEHMVDESEFAERFAREADVIAALDHPNIIPVYATGITHEVPWMALQYVDGGNLADWFAARPIPIPEGLAILRSVASALDFAHWRGIIHRDLKPQNILLTVQGSVFLADFGIAKLIESAKALTAPRHGKGSLTNPGAAIGTPDYMSPEQALAQGVGPFTDVYALAVICFEWLTGSVPFSADTPFATMIKHVNEPLPTELLKTLTPAVAAVLRRGLAKKPEERIQKAGELIAELERALGVQAQAPASVRPEPAALITEPLVKANAEPVTGKPEPQAKPEPPAAKAEPLARRDPKPEPSAARAEPQPAPCSPDVLAAEATTRARWRWLAAGGLTIAGVLAWQSGLFRGPAPQPQPGSSNTLSQSAPTSAPAKPQPQPQPSATTPTTTPAESSTGTLLLSTDAECLLKIDGSAKGTLRPNAPRTETLSTGEHLVSCASSVRAAIVGQEKKSVTAGRQEVVVFAIGAQLAAEQKDEDAKKAEALKAEEANKAEQARIVEQNRQAEADRIAEEAGKPEAARQTLGRNGGFVDSGNGKLTDTTTGLVWTQIDNGADIKWSYAQAYCADKGMRLPSIDELSAIFARSGAGTTRCGNYTCKVSPLFHLTNSWFWSGAKDGSSRAWGFDVDDGIRSTYFVINRSEKRALCVGSF